MKPPLTVDELIAGGFEKAGCWSVDATGAVEILDLPARAGVYAFAIDGVAQYVGIASNSLSRRLRFYARPGITQRTSQRLNHKIVELCTQGHQIDVLIAHPSDFDWGGFIVKGAEGLEAGIISSFSLPWNIRGAGNRKAAPMNGVRETKTPNRPHSGDVEGYFVYENWVRDKAIVHRSSCSFCNDGNGLHGSRTTKSSTWHGPYSDAAGALARAMACRRSRTEGCSTCSPI